MRTLTTVEKWTYAAGNVPFAVKDAAFINFVVFYYTQVQGLSGSLTGLAMFIAISWDAISDPVVGSWSDSVRSRWGRRHPLMAIGGLPTALLFIALFFPPRELGEVGIFAWLLVVSILLRTFLTIYFIPYTAMGAELSTDYDERTVIAKGRISVAWLAGMLLPAIGFAFIFQSTDGQDGRLVADNYLVYGLVSAVVAAVTAIACVVGTRRVIPFLPAASDESGRFSLAGTLTDFRLAFGNRNFRVSVGANLAFGMCAGVYSTLALYLGTYFWEFSADQLAALVVPTAIATGLAFMVLARLGRRFDKVTLLCAASLGIAFNTAWFIGARLLGWLPENGHALIYPLQWLNTGFGVFCIVALQVISVSLLADILDEQELETGRRQEGVFFAAGAFVSKATTGFGTLLAGIAIEVSGIAPGAAPGEVPTPTLQTLGWMTVGMIVTLALVAFVFASRLQLSRAGHERVRRALERGRTGAEVSVSD